MGQVLRLVLKNCVRNRARTILTILGISVGVIAFGFLQTVLAAYYIGSEASSPTRIVTRHRVSLFNPLPVAHRERIARIPGITQVSYGNWFGGYYKDPDKFFAQFAVDDGYIDLYPEFLISPQEKAAFLGDLQGAIVGRKLAARFGWKVGDRITLTGTAYPGAWDFIIHGVYHGRERNTDETALMFRWKRLDEFVLAADRVSQIGWYLIGIENAAESGRISDEIDALFMNSTAPTLTETEKDFNLSFVSMMGTIITIIKLAAWIVIGIILLVMANTMAMAARERTSEYGILKTMGFGPLHIASLIGGEALAVSFTGALVGCILTVALVRVAGAGIEEQMGQIFPVFELTGMTAAQSVVLAIAAGLLACIPSIVRAIRIPIASALRQVG